MATRIFNYLENKKCEVFHAPFDVRLPLMGATENEAIYTVVQPDICVVCDPSKLDTRGCLGAPDLIIEIVSPNNAGRDIKEKYDIYEKAGVFEYWIVRPSDQTVEVYLLSGMENTNVVARMFQATLFLFLSSTMN